MKKNSILLLLLIGTISIGLTSCQNEDVINNIEEPSAASSSEVVEKVQSISLTVADNLSIYDFGLGACNASKSGNTITISDFKADCTIGPFTIMPNDQSEPWRLIYSNFDGMFTVDSYNSSSNANNLLESTAQGSKSFYLHISRSFLKSGKLYVYYLNNPSIKSELVINRL